MYFDYVAIPFKPHLKLINIHLSLFSFQILLLLHISKHINFVFHLFRVFTVSYEYECYTVSFERLLYRVTL